MTDDVAREVKWQAGLMRALNKLPIDPPREREEDNEEFCEGCTIDCRKCERRNNDHDREA